MWNYNGSITNNGTFNQNNSINITNNFNIRINLQEREASGKIYEYTLFCLHEYNKAKNVPDGYLRVTCINVHSDNMFVSDHIHIDFPKKMYDEISYNYSIMKVKAKAYAYPKGNKVDYGLKVTKIESAVNRLGHYEGKYGTKNLPIIKTDIEKDQRMFFKHVYQNEISHECLTEILSKQINYLEGMITESNHIYSGFLFDMLMTYYFANDYRQELESKSLYIHNLDKCVIIDLLHMLSKIIFKINNSEIFMWRHLLIEINELCNVKQEITKDISKKNRYNKDEFNDIDKSVQVFANKINGNETKKMFDKIKRRNEDYGYQYPKNIDKYKEQLHDYVIWYLLNQRDLKLDMYYPEWKEDVNEI